MSTFFARRLRRHSTSMTHLWRHSQFSVEFVGTALMVHCFVQLLHPWCLFPGSSSLWLHSRCRCNELFWAGGYCNATCFCSYCRGNMVHLRRNSCEELSVLFQLTHGTWLFVCGLVFTSIAQSPQHLPGRTVQLHTRHRLHNRLVCTMLQQLGSRPLQHGPARPHVASSSVSPLYHKARGNVVQPMFTVRPDFATVPTQRIFRSCSVSDVPLRFGPSDPVHVVSEHRETSPEHRSTLFTVCSTGATLGSTFLITSSARMYFVTSFVTSSWVRLGTDVTR